MKPWIPFVACAVLSSNFAAAQSIVYQDGFENGLANWTATGLWNAEQSTDSCGALAAPFPEGTGAAWYGIQSSCNFQNGVANAGILTMNSSVTIPSNVASATLYFQSFVNSEYCWGGWDNCAVIVTSVGGPNGGFWQTLCSGNGPESSQLPWHERRIDLTAYRGFDVKIGFSFWAGDVGYNETLCWLVDNVRIQTEPGTPMCPTTLPLTQCPCHPKIGVGGGCFTSQGKSATLMSSGVASVAADTLSFQAAEMPPGTAATLFQATNTLTPTTFGDGLMCVTGSLIRLGTQFAPTGVIGWPMASLGSLSSTGFVPPTGGDYYYQAIFRDAVPTHCTTATFNLTSAHKVSWTP